MPKRLTNPRQEAQDQLELITLLTVRFKPKFKSEIKKTINKAMDEFKEHGLFSFYIINEHQENLKEILKQTFERSIYISSERQKNIINQELLAKKEDKPKENNILKTLFAIWVGKNILKQAKLIAGTTEKELLKNINVYKETGLNNEEIAKEINNKLGVDGADNRSELIALSSVHSSFNYANFETTKEIVNNFDKELLKEWVHTGLSREPRETHLAANGQTVKADEMFIVDGEAMEMPGDPNASIGNTINCTCVLSYKI